VTATVSAAITALAVVAALSVRAAETVAFDVAVVAAGTCFGYFIE